MSVECCRYCYSTDLTTEGVPASWQALGFKKCLDCGRTMRPIVFDSVAAASEALAATIEKTEKVA